MKLHFPLKRAALATGVSLLLGVSVATLVWAAGATETPQQTGPTQAVVQAAGLDQAQDPAPDLDLGIARELLSGTGAERAVRRAWQLAKDAGAYRFVTDLTQTAYPARTLAVAGSSLQEQSVYLEGEVDVAARALSLRLRQGGGSAQNAPTSTEARVEGARAYIRTAGGAWQETDDFSGGFAPGTDPLAYLTAMKNVREAVEPRSDSSGRTPHISRFTFDLDGPTFAAYMRDQMEQQLRDKGELPLNLHLDTSAEYRNMTGSGEIFTDERGLPLRLTVHLVYPEQRNGTHVEAAIRTDFAGFAAPPAAAPALLDEPVDWADHILRSGASALGVSAPSAGDLRNTADQVGVIFCSLGLLAVFIPARRSRRLYSAIVLAVICSMVIIPLLQSERVDAFFDRQEQQVQAQQEKQAVREAAASRTAPAWDPHRNPLTIEAAPTPARLPASGSAGVVATSTPTPGDSCDSSDTADADGDALNNYDECLMGTNPALPDTDHDGLTDGQEVYRVGTAPAVADTDGDQISDFREVQGFTYADKPWYMDPTNPDTNGDGQIDSIECPPLMEGGTITEDVIRDQCDADKDNVLDLFEDDNDNDGIPDRVDLSPNDVLDRNGIIHNGAALQPNAAYNSEHPFPLLVSGLQPGYPSFVDLQVRPVTAKHLTYALNVLDWPTGDIDGQIQHGKDTNFANTDNLDIQQPGDETGQYGDTRLVPIMEIEMTGSSVPLKLTDPAITMTVSGELSATIKLTQQAANHSNTDLNFTFAESGGHDVKIYAGGCPAIGAALKTFTNVTSSSQSYAGQKLTGLADAEHAMVISQGTKSVCASIPNIINGPYTEKMIDLSVLAPYGIGVLEAEVQASGGRSLQAYVPLNLAPDATGGGRTAFQARMLYWPGSDNNAWTQAQQVRVLWVVQMLTDTCEEEGFPLDEKYAEEDPEDYDKQLKTWCTTHRTMDDLQVVQRYDESWYLTGLHVREDHGLDVAIAYVQPGSYADQLHPPDDQDLWQLSWGLGQMFVPGRDCETDEMLRSDSTPDTCHRDTYRDAAVYENNPAGTRIGNTTIAGRFDSADKNKNGTPDNEEYANAKGWSAQRRNELRWGIPVNALFVDTVRYPHQDYLGYMSSTETPRVLGQFPQWASPTLLYAREERYRSAGMAAASLANGVLTVSADPKDHGEETVAGMIWGPYRYNSGVDSVTSQIIGWEAYPSEEYYAKLGDSLQQRFDRNFPEDIGPVNEGLTTVARNYYIALLSGIATKVEVCTAGAECEEEGESDEELIKSSEELADKIAEVGGELVKQMIEVFHEVSLEFAQVERSVDNVIAMVLEVLVVGPAKYAGVPWLHLFDKVGGWGGLFAAVGVVIIVIGAVVAIALSFILGTDASDAELVSRILLSVTLVVSLLVVARAVAKVATELAKGAGKLLKDSIHEFNHELHANKTFIIVAVVISVVITWAAFALEWGLGHMAIGSMAWNNALVSAIASSITTILLFTICTALGPLGELIWAVIGLIDSLVALVCNSFLSTEQQEGTAGQWLCGGITGLISHFLKWTMYSSTILVDMSDESRLQLTNFDLTDLTYPEQGIVAGNAIRYKIALTNTIDLVDVPVNPHEAMWFWQFKDDNLKKATFEYKWQEEEEDFHDDLSLDDMKSDWRKSSGGRYYYATPVDSDEAFPLPETGINQPVELFLSEAYALPAQECWGVGLWGLISACYIRSEKGTTHYNIGEELVFDVLPATLDGFYALAKEGTGWVLAWSQDAAMSFGVQHDADGDGLSFADDPDDSAWDYDSDGLSDQYEQQTGSNPRERDGDHDGMSDQEEAVFGTNPAVADTDGDGLTDKEENTGWKIVSGLGSDGAPQYTWVWSDPLQVDIDSDGLLDAQERTYGYNPYVRSDPNVLVLSSELRDMSGAALTASDGIVRPGDRLHYTATVENKLDMRTAQGLLSTVSPDILNNQDVPPSPFILQPLQQQAMVGTIVVSQTAASGVYSLTQVAGALITDWQSIAGGAKLWLRFDDPAGVTEYADSSGQIPPHPGHCSNAGGCTPDPAGGQFGGALQLNGNAMVLSDVQVPQKGYAVSLWFKLVGAGDLFWLAAPDGTGLLLISVQQNQIMYWMKGTDGRMDVKYVGPRVNDNNWHHLVHTVGSNIGGQRLYVDGVLMDSSSANAFWAIPRPGVNFGQFKGSLDDARVFDRGLTEAEVEALASPLVLHMDFDAQDRWVDTASFHTTIASCAYHCPAHVAAGVAGGAVSFDGTTYLSTAESAVLDLSRTPFTLAALVYPMSRGDSDARDTSPQGIIGHRSGAADGSPSLQRVGKKIRFGMGTSQGWKSWTSADVLTANNWSHVAVTFDPAASSVKLYVDGVLKGEDTTIFRGLTPAASSPSLDIGRSTDLGQLDLRDGHCDDISDGGCPLHEDELCMAIDEAQEIFNKGDVDCDEDFHIDRSLPITGSLTLRMWEDDGGVRCGPVRDDDDDTLKFKYDSDGDGDDEENTTEVFDYTRPGPGTEVKRKYSGGNSGWFHFTYTSDAIPFYGKVDELTVYNQALDAAAIQNLASVMALYLRLDEPAGSSAFQNGGMEDTQANCTNCPTTGVAGRNNQAVWFKSAQKNTLFQANGSINRTTNNLTVAAWIKPDTHSGLQAIVATARYRSANGFGFFTNGTGLRFSTFGVKDYDLAGAVLTESRWYHVAAVLDPNDTVIFYVDGVNRGSVTGTAPATPDTDDVLMIGGTTEPGSSALAYTFDGHIDDVRVYRRALSLMAIQGMIDQAPVLHQRFDDGRGTRFEDSAQAGNAGTCASPRCPDTGEAIPGQFGLALLYDGSDDLVTVPDSNRLDLDTGTIGAWVMPTSMGTVNYSQELIGKLTTAGTQPNYELSIASNSLTASLAWNCPTSSNQVLTSTVPLISNHWNHVMGTYDRTSGMLRIYVNGSESGHVAVSRTACPNTGVLAIGGFSNQALHSFAGRIDEVVVYRIALSAREVRELYTYQAGWVEDRESYNLTVDADNPTVNLPIAEGSYLAKQPNLVTITADDRTSGVAAVTLNSPGGPVSAPRCTDVGSTAAWCPIVTPTSQGKQTLTATATDRAGNSTTSASRSLYIDDAAPQVTISGADMHRLDAQPSAAQANTWQVHLSGTAADPSIGGGVAGSGVPSDGVHVTLTGAGGAIAGQGRQVAALSGNNWSLDYLIPDARASGQYTVTVEAVDQVARLPGLAAGQVARHSGTAQKHIVIDASGPAVQIDRGNIANGQIVSATVVTGVASDRPTPVQVAWTASADASKAGLAISCAGPSTPYTIYSAGAGTFTDGQTYSWRGNLHRGSACHVQLTTTAATGGISGTIQVCGSEITNWVGNWITAKDVAFSVEAAACDPQVAVAGVGLVETAFGSVMPGSAFINEASPAGEILHLPFDDGPDSTGALSFRDVSAVNSPGSCSGDACPATGQAGHSGSAPRFDGVTDVVTVAQVAGQGTSDTLSIAAWIRPDGPPVKHGTFLARKNLWEVARFSDEQIGWAFNTGTQYHWYGTGFKAPLDQWTHIVVVFSTGTLQTYANGTLVNTRTVSGTVSNANYLAIGSLPVEGEYFAGSIDEVRLFSRALSSDEVRALYSGSAPVLQLGFEQAWTSGGAVVADSSGWGLTGTLHTGAQDIINKAAPGQVGAYALSFDGVDDNLAIADFGVFTTTSVSAWVNLAATQPARQTVVSYKEAGDCGFMIGMEDLTPKFAVKVGGAWVAASQSNVKLPLHQWVHLAGAYDGSTLRLYRDGQQVAIAPGVGGMAQCSGITTVGSRSSQDGSWFPGIIDDVRIYPRGIPPEEVRDIYLSGWRQATFTGQHGAGVETSAWSSAAPAGLEGYYEVELRGTDAAQHAQTVNERASLWRGAVDTLAPRVTLQRTAVDASTYRYATIAEDFDLVEDGFTTPCGAVTTTVRVYNVSPWYLAAAGENAAHPSRLYQLAVECLLPAGTTERATACDSFGNCATVGATPVGAQAAAVIALPTAGPGVRIMHAAVPSTAASAAAAPPAVSFGTTVLTSTAYYEPRTIEVTGLVTGTEALANVQVSIGGVTGTASLGQTEATPPFTTTWRFPWRLGINEPLPDGATYPVTATATDLAGQMSAVTATLTVDVAPPAPVTVILTANGQAVQPGDTLRTAAAELMLAWTAAADGSGLAPYQVTWTWQETGTITTTASLHDPAGVREDRFTANEARRLSVSLISRDGLGNERVQTGGPIYVDGPHTPDYVYLPAADGGAGSEVYNDWVDSACTLIGVDRRAAAAPPGCAQQLYATWDRQALRLAWAGAQWTSGDLFIYLDTNPGGTEQTFTPLAVAVTGTVVSLPASLGADTLVWVQDARTASLLRWNGSAWGSAVPLASGQYRFDAALNGGQTDLYLPFDLLGITSGSSLGLLAFAAEEPAPGIGLRIWATLPNVNPANSSLVNPLAMFAGQDARFAMSHAYRWSALSDGRCPNGADGSSGSGYADTELLLSITATPSGVAAGGRGSGLFWLSDPSAASAALLTFLQHSFPPVDDGQEIHYTVHYRNTGTQSAHGVWMALSTVGPLRLLDTTVTLGDIAPGAEGSATFRAVVGRGASTAELAEVKAFVYDASHGPTEPALDWLWTFHRADQGAPVQMAIETPGAFVGPEAATLSGYAHDESGVAMVEVEVLSPSGNRSIVTCPVTRPMEGVWSCPWDVAASNGGARPAHGEAFTLRMAAIDTFGHRSGWSAAREVWVDARPPIVTLDQAASGVYTTAVSSGLVNIFGTAYDLAGIGSVGVCIAGECGNARLQAAQVIHASWAYRPATNPAWDYVERTITVIASDRLGNRLPTPLTLDVWVDNVTPVITVTTATSVAYLGTPSTVLAGTVADGDSQTNVSVRVGSPEGASSRQAAARDGAAWWYDLPADTPGRYTLWVDAQDQAGNLSTVGPFTVSVGCLAADLTVADVAAEPQAGAPLSLTLSAVVHNAGPDTLPAGVPVSFYERSRYIGSVLTLQTVSPGGSAAISTTWTSVDAGNHDVSVVLDEPGPGVSRRPASAAAVPLCRTPDTVHTVVAVRDVSLDGSWNLVSSPVQPFVTAVTVVERPIHGNYEVILGYDQGWLSYEPDRPAGENSLKAVDVSRGYWVKTIQGPTPPPTDTQEVKPVTTLWLVGHEVPEDQAITLAAGWNLVGYLPHEILPVTQALEGIAGRYDAALGFAQTGLSYYPDLAAGFNTLFDMAPASGYWIRANQAMTLHYPVTTMTPTAPITTTPEGLSPAERVNLIRQAEQAAGVLPSYEWMNFYGRVILPEGTAAPTGTVVLAVDPQGVICGATVVAYPGQYGLLACYRDDPYTTADEGAQPGDAIRLLISSDGMHPDGQVIGTGTWTANGDREQVPAQLVQLHYLPLISTEEHRPYYCWLPWVVKE